MTHPPREPMRTTMRSSLPAFAAETASAKQARDEVRHGESRCSGHKLPDHRSKSLQLPLAVIRSRRIPSPHRIPNRNRTSPPCLAATPRSATIRLQHHDASILKRLSLAALAFSRFGSSRKPVAPPGQRRQRAYQRVPRRLQDAHGRADPAAHVGVVPGRIPPDLFGSTTGFDGAHRQQAAARPAGGHRRDGGAAG